jgi:hypothetical protein
MVPKLINLKRIQTVCTEKEKERERQRENTERGKNMCDHFLISQSVVQQYTLYYDKTVTAERIHGIPATYPLHLTTLRTCTLITQVVTQRSHDPRII